MTPTYLDKLRTHAETLRRLAREAVQRCDWPAHEALCAGIVQIDDRVQALEREGRQLTEMRASFVRVVDAPAPEEVV